MLRFLRKTGFDPFVLTLLGAILLAWVWPAGGADHATWSPSAVAGWGVSVIFFFYGLRLDWRSLADSLRNYRLHLVVQLTTFVLFPLLILAAMQVADPGQNDYLWLGVFFMATLPSTVSSSVVMVSLAGGNIPAAIFNASLSSLAGVFITPLWMSLFLTAGSGGNELDEVIVNLVLQVILPLGAGMLLHRRWGEWARHRRRWITLFDQAVILAIVYTSFCESFAQDMFSTVSAATLGWLLAGMAGLFFGVYGIVWGVCRWLRFERGDRITALFCGSKKSLVHGTVMARVLVADHTLTGILLLPIMVYHAMQLVLVGVIAGRMSREK